MKVSPATLNKMLPLITAAAPLLLAGLGLQRGCEGTSPPGPSQVLRPGSTPGQAPSAGQAPPPAPHTPNPTVAQTASYSRPGSRDFLFCFWNVENLFDDKDDRRTGAGDKEYDPLFAQRPDLLRQKLDKLSDAILSFNGGRGPDVLAMVEIEGIRAAQLLQYALNSRLGDPNLYYRNLIMKEMGSGRHIAPAILTRLDVNANRTRSHGSRQRILEGRVVVDGKELILIVGHWTSRLQSDGAENRMQYAEKIYGACNAIYLSDPGADFLVCGDFNDDPNDPSVVKGLRSTTNLQEALAPGSMLRLVNLFGNWTRACNCGSLYYQGWNMFDQILVSPGMFDARAWRCDPASVRIGNHLHQPNDPQRRPWRFGGANEKGPRGYSDHFPVTVNLHLAP